MTFNMEAHWLKKSSSQYQSSRGKSPSIKKQIKIEDNRSCSSRLLQSKWRERNAHWKVLHETWPIFIIFLFSWKHIHRMWRSFHVFFARCAYCGLRGWERNFAQPPPKKKKKRTTTTTTTTTTIYWTFKGIFIRNKFAEVLPQFSF